MRVEIVYSEAGSGHRSSALALRTVLAERQPSWEVSLANLQEVLEPIDLVAKLIGLRVEDTYNRMLQTGRTLGHPAMFRFGQLLIRLHEPASARILEAWWRERRPDLVVSLIPNFNGVISDTLARAVPGARFVTILTDFSDLPPHTWIERRDQYVVCGTDRAAGQALAFGVPADRVFRTSGMILDPSFYDPVVADRQGERRKLGLAPDVATGIVVFGGQGSPALLTIVRRLDRSCLRVQLIVVCGLHREAERELRALRTRIPLLVLGFTDRMPYYLSLADFLIGKPGAGAVSQAVAMRLPLIVDSNARTLLQERANAQWVGEQGVGLVVRSFRRVERAVARLLEPAAYERLRAAEARIANRAVFEVPGILEAVVAAPGVALAHRGIVRYNRRVPREQG